MFASNLDGSFVAHQYAVAAYASRAVDSPTVEWGCEGIPGDAVPTLTKERAYGASVFPCFNNPTIGIDADKAGLSWRFYAGRINDPDGIWSSYQADGQNQKRPRLEGQRDQPASALPHRR